MPAEPGRREVALDSNARGLGTAGAKDNHQSTTSVAHDAALTRDIAEVMAWMDYITEEIAVVELLLLAYNAPAKETRLRALRALEWFDPRTTEEPARATLPPADSDVEAALGALRWLLYGWTRVSRLHAANRCRTSIAQLAERAS